MTDIRLGTAAFTAAGWPGTFYPESLPEREYERGRSFLVRLEASTQNPTPKWAPFYTASAHRHVAFARIPVSVNVSRDVAAVTAT